MANQFKNELINHAHILQKKRESFVIKKNIKAGDLFFYVKILKRSYMDAIITNKLK